MRDWGEGVCIGMLLGAGLTLMLTQPTQPSLSNVPDVITEGHGVGPDYQVDLDTIPSKDINKSISDMIKEIAR